MDTGHAPAVLVTGAAAGIGRATALRLAADGWHCVLVDADAQALQGLLALWPAQAPAPRLLAADLTDALQIERLGGQLPPLDALINNAGMSAGGASALDVGDMDRSTRLMALNLAAPARMVQVCAAHLRPGARIVNVASGAGLRAIGWRGLYSPSKAGVIAQTRALAQARPDWTVNALAPGFVRTELVQGLIASGRLDPAQALAKVPLGRMAEPEEMAEALCFLASEGAPTLAGHLLVVDGGSSVCGGSQPLPPALQPPLAANLPVALRCEAIRAPAWREALGSLATAPEAQQQGYPAVVDGSAWDAAPGTVLAAVLDAARRFRASHGAPASLTLLLPPAAADTPWEQAGDLEAARMLMATLAVEWGATGLRINGLQPGAGVSAHSCLPTVAYVTGARAQYLTGQVLQPVLRQ